MSVSYLRTENDRLRASSFELRLFVVFVGNQERVPMTALHTLGFATLSVIRLTKATVRFAGWIQPVDATRSLNI